LRAGIASSIIFLLCVPAAMAAAVNVDFELSNEMQELMRSALIHSSDNVELENAIAKFSKSSEKGKFGAKDIGLNYLGLPRGLEASIEGAKLVLGEPNAAKNLEAAECAMQIENDRLHRELCGSILQLACGLGSRQAAKSREHNTAALTRLEKLVGSADAAKVAESIISWGQSVGHIRDSVWKQTPLEFIEVQDEANRIAQMAEQHDFAIIGLKNKLHRFSDHTRAKRRGSKFVEGTVSAVTMFGPGFGTPIAAQTVGAMWGVTNGGSEESKLLKEIYYQRQLESRSAALRAEASMILLAYQDALRTKNIPLLVTAEALLAQLVGALGVAQVLDQPVINHGTFAGRTIANTGLGN